MSVLAPERIPIDPPEFLPVSHLSVSSLNLYERCPLAWKHRYVDKRPERPSGKMTLGSSAGAALHQHFGRQLETGEGMSTEELLDEYSADWWERTEREDVDYQSDTPGQLFDSGAEALRMYHVAIAPSIVPVAIEREFELSWPGAPFVVSGFLDLETEAGAVVDFKMTTKRWSEDKAGGEIQPTVYLAARRAEGNPATAFEYHTMIRRANPMAEVVPTPRTERQLDLLTTRVFSIARSIEWRWLNDVWQGTGPDVAWLCRGCGYAADCDWRRI